MKHNIKQFTLPSLLITGLITSPLILADGFDGHTINVKFERWGTDDPTTLLDITNNMDVLVTNATNPDIKDFYVFKESVDTYDWDIDFNQNRIELTYTSIYVQDFDHQYMYTSARGFHFQDIEGHLPPIIGVTIDDRFAPFGFNAELVTFDADNIYVNLRGSMCHVAGMASMPQCDSENSTGYDNQIKLVVEFAEQADSGADIDRSRIDALFNSIENGQYKEYFPSHQESTEMLGYYVRYYPATEVYLGTKEGRLVVFNQALFGGLLDVGSLISWLDNAGL